MSTAIKQKTASNGTGLSSSSPPGVVDWKREGTATSLAKDLPSVPHTEEMLLKVRHCKSSNRDITLCYQCFGNPDDGRPAVLLVCGLNMQLYAWDETFCEDLVRAGFFVIRYDNRDIGYSTKIEDCGSVVGARLLLPSSWATTFGEKLPYTLDDMAKDGLALLTALKIERAHVFGISMGGSIAQLMALIAPEVVLSLTSLMSTTNPPDLPDAQMWVKLHMLRSPPKNCTVEQLLQFRASSLKKLLEHALPVDDAYLKHRYYISLNRSSYGKGLIRQAAALRRCAARDEPLKRLTIPALVIHGAQDLVVPPNHGFRTASVIPHARLLVFKSMGHYFHPAFFHAIIVAFADMASTTSGPGLPNAEKPLTVHETGVERPVGTSAAAASPSPSPLLMMASLGHMLRPVVTTDRTNVGAAAVKAVNVAVPGVGDPILPEAVLLDLHHHHHHHHHHGAEPGQRSDSEEDKTVPYVAGSPSVWNVATFPSPIRKTEKGSFAVEEKKDPSPSAETNPSRSGVTHPVISGTPLNVVLARNSNQGTETAGGRRSRPISRRPSFSAQAEDEPVINGIAPAPPMPLHVYTEGGCADVEEQNVDPKSPATAEDVATTTLMPSLLTQEDIAKMADRVASGNGQEEGER